MILNWRHYDQKGKMTSVVLSFSELSQNTTLGYSLNFPQKLFSLEFVTAVNMCMAMWYV